MPAPSAAPLRADAVRNRQAIVGAAQSVFGQRGLEAPLDEIAREAGVGNATLYRHFPSRCALVAEVFAATLRTVAAAAGEALTDPDPWHAFTTHVRFLCRLQATDRGLADLLTTAIPGAPELERLRRRSYRDFVRIADRARANGSLRADFVPEDLVLILMANAGLVHRTASTAPSAWERLLGVTLDGLRGDTDPTPAPPPPRPAAVARAMADQAGLFGRD